MTCYEIEIRIDGAGRREVDRVAWALTAAQARLRRTGDEAPTVAIAPHAAGGAVVCRMEAPTLESLRNLLRIALLPPVRVRSVG